MLLTKKERKRERKKERNRPKTIPRPPIGGGVINEFKETKNTNRTLERFVMI